MQRIRLVLAVLGVLVVMVGSAVPAIAQGSRDDEVIYYNQGDDYGRVNYDNDTACGWYWSSYEGWTE